MPVEDPSAASIESRLRAACLEMERRARAGDEWTAEHLLTLYPGLSEDTDSALELVFAEFVLRRQRGELTSPEHWYARFPHWRERLARLFQVYELMGAEVAPATHAAGDTLGPQPLRVPQTPDGKRRRIGAYEVLDEIARGGMGVVYKARHVGLNRLVALKLILAGEHAGAEQRARFGREAEAAARLQHPNIVQIYEVGHHDDLPFLAMEYVDGPRLDELLGDRRAGGSAGLPPRQAAELVETLARAMHHAHQQGVVHRDLKPANILLRIADCGLRTSDCQSEISDLKSVIPKITDFGLAKTLNESRVETRTGALLGTPCYMSPEQAAGRPAEIGPATDVFALGVMLYELLTGCLPFPGPSIEETLEQIRSVEPRPPIQLQRSLPRDLQTICLKCLQKEQVKRYQSAGALADELRRFLDDQPILARPVGRGERAWRWCRRNPVVAALAAGVATLLVCGSALSTGLAVWALAERGRERQARALADQRFAQAEQAVEDYLDGIEKNDRLKEADFLDLRKQLLASAVPFYEDFVQARPGDAALEAKRGRAYYRMASLRQQLGDSDHALADFRQMQAIFQKLVADFPSVPEFRRELALSYGNLGLLLHALGKQSDVEHAQAIALYQSLVSDSPTAAEDRQGLAWSHSNSGVLLADQGKRAEAVSAFRQALDLRQHLSREFPEIPKYRLDLAASHANFGKLYLAMNRRAEAESHYLQALSIRDSLAASFPKVPEYRRELARAYTGLGDLLRQSGNSAEAATTYRHAVDVYTALIADFPTIPHYQVELADCHNNLGILFKQLGMTSEAHAADLQSLDLKQQLAARFPTVPDYRRDVAVGHNNLGRLLAALGKRAEARAEYDEALRVQMPIIEHSPAAPAFRDDVATMLANIARLVREDNDLAEARRLLGQAIQHQLMACQLAPQRTQYTDRLRNHCHSLGDVLLLQRDHVATAENARRLAQVRPDVPDDAYLAARFCGRCVPLAEQDSGRSESERHELAQCYADQAMEHLHQAVGRGYTDANALKSAAALAPLNMRPDFQQLVVDLYRVHGREEGEALKVLRVTEGTARPQLMTQFATGRWRGDQQLWWNGARPGARLELEIPVNADGTYDLDIVLTKAPDYGVVQLWLDDAKIGDPVDLFHAAGVVTAGVLRHSGLPLTAGRHVLSVEIVGANPSAIKSYVVGLDYVRLVPTP